MIATHLGYAAFGALLFFLGACSSGSKGGDADRVPKSGQAAGTAAPKAPVDAPASAKPPAPETAVPLVDCETQWQQFVAARKLGLSVRYLETQTNHGDEVDFEGTRVLHTRQTVIESNAGQITTDMHTPVCRSPVLEAIS